MPEIKQNKKKSKGRLAHLKISMYCLTLLFGRIEDNISIYNHV